jgi:hypothetical protein
MKPGHKQIGFFIAFEKASQASTLGHAQIAEALFSTRTGATMDPTDLGAGTATWLGGTGTILLGGFLWLRRFLSKDATERAMDNADIGTVRRLNELLDSERTARLASDARADQFARERNELAAAVGRMEGKIESLSSQVTLLTEKVTTQSAELSRLRSQLGGAA